MVLINSIRKERKGISEKCPITSRNVDNPTSKFTITCQNTPTRVLDQISCEVFTGRVWVKYPWSLTIVL